MGQVISGVFDIQSSVETTTEVEKHDKPSHSDCSPSSYRSALQKVASSIRKKSASHHTVASYLSFITPSSSSRFPAPTCKEQLLDWTRDATATVHHIHRVLERLRFMGRNIVLSFHAYNHRTNDDTDDQQASSSDALIVTQDDITLAMIQVVAFESCSCMEFDLTKLSIHEFRRVLYLFSRIIQLDDRICRRQSQESSSSSSSECNLCRVDREQILLPNCLHGICRRCHERWVVGGGMNSSSLASCPFCHQTFPSMKRLQGDEWEIEQWNPSEIEKEIQDMEEELKTLLWGSPRIRRSTSYSSNDDDENDGRKSIEPMIAATVVVSVDEDARDAEDDDGFSLLETREQQDRTATS